MRADERHLICLDIDGTVMTYGSRDDAGVYTPGTIDPLLADAIRALHKAGHEVVISTGRSVESTLDTVEALRITPDHVVCANGAITLKRDPLATRAYRRDRVEGFDPTELLTRIRTHLVSAAYALETVEGELLYTERIPSGTIAVTQHQVPFEKLLGVQATRVLVVSTDHDLERFIRISEELGLHSVQYAIGMTTWFDIAPEGVSKASALELLREQLGINRRNVFAAGDGDNDVQMLQWAGRHGVSVAMGDARQYVKDAATHVTGSIYENGLFTALRDRFSWLDEREGLNIS